MKQRASINMNQRRGLKVFEEFFERTYKLRAFVVAAAAAFEQEGELVAAVAAPWVAKAHAWASFGLTLRSRAQPDWKIGSKQ